jgi:hypothetical protein
VQGLVEFLKSLGASRIAAMGAVSIALIGFRIEWAEGGITRASAAVEVAIGAAVTRLCRRARNAEEI